MTGWVRCMVLSAVLAWPVPVVYAKTILVGPDQALKFPSAADQVAKDGDTVEIEPMKGGYFDCANWHQNNLTIEGKGPGVVITDKTCEGKGLFIVSGNNVTVRNITFQRARVPDHNGAGIRSQGTNLTVDHCRFLDNENGILSNVNLTASHVIITNSEFVDNGSCSGPGCAHGIYINQVALLRVENSVFKRTHHGHHIKSRAAETVLIGNTIEDGPTGNSSYLVDIPNGGTLIMQNNTLEKGPDAENHSTAVTLGEEGVTQRTKEITITNNTFTNDMSHPTIFVRNLTATPAILKGNKLVGQIKPLDGDGKVE
ncbi:MAG TPA: right-handed parallel beta-helix repeat-containing protein [Stellaceae bacterium]|nr:right-handed parallel beta-helix repeat-containing protein [Stellaceae bacterium]